MAETPETLSLRQLIDTRRNEFFELLAKYRATNPRLLGSVARCTSTAISDIDILVDMNEADGNILMRAAGLLTKTRELFGRDDIDIFPAQLLKEPIAAAALAEAVSL